MRIEPFLLEQWLETEVDYNLALSTGPSMTVGELFALMEPEKKEHLWEETLTYRPSRGTDSLRQTLAGWYRVSDEDVQIVTGASEALLTLFFLAAEADANVVVPSPGFPTFTAVPESMGLETRSYPLRHENHFEIDVDEVERLVDERTKLLLVNTPHNPTGMTVRPETLRELHDFAADRGVQFVVDEVYHPIYFGEQVDSAVNLPNATILGDTSKSLCSSGLRVGWVIERDRSRRESYCNTRSYFTISNTILGEALAEVAVRHREDVFSRAQEVAVTNLRLLDGFFADHQESLEWIRPRGGFTAFPRMANGDDARPFCQQAARSGVLLAPGDCFGWPSHFRLGFGACHRGFDKALEILSDAVFEHRNPSRTGSSRSVRS